MAEDEQTRILGFRPLDEASYSLDGAVPLFASYPFDHPRIKSGEHIRLIQQPPDWIILETKSGCVAATSGGLNFDVISDKERNILGYHHLQLRPRLGLESVENARAVFRLQDNPSDVAMFVNKLMNGLPCCEISTPGGLTVTDMPQSRRSHDNPPIFSLTAAGPSLLYTQPDGFLYHHTFVTYPPRPFYYLVIDPGLDYGNPELMAKISVIISMNSTSFEDLDRQLDQLAIRKITSEARIRQVIDYRLAVELV